jgi:ribosomal protein L31
MRKGIHPLQRALTVINTKGASVTVLSTLRPPNGQLFLQSDTTTHPAWTGKRKELAATGRAALFKQKFDFSLMDFRGGKTAAPKAAAAPAAAPAAAKTAKPATAGKKR